MKNTARTNTRGRSGHLFVVLLAALALALGLGSRGGSEAATAGPAEGEPTVTTAAGGQTVDSLPLLTVDRIESGIDGYTAHLTDSTGGDYTTVISIPNLADTFVLLEVGDVVTIAGEYAESFPVQIHNITNITVETAMS